MELTGVRGVERNEAAKRRAREEPRRRNAENGSAFLRG